MIKQLLTTLLFGILSSISLCAATIDTFYGPIEVEEPVLLELIESAAFQRLKSIHQYGVSYYTTHKEEYTRYAHSLGVFTVLRAKGASLKEQVAGLLHDVSHTAFSHVGDWIFNKENQETDYQSSIHELFLEKSGLADILKKYGFTADQMVPEEETFPALEQKNPNLCADRIDYNIQGAFYQGFITYSEAIAIFEELEFVQGHWIGKNQELLKKLVRFSLFMTQDCWGGPVNHLLSRWLADAILRAVHLGCITYEDIHFGTDQVIWDLLNGCEDLFIQKKMQQIKEPDTHYHLTDPSDADVIVKNKFRGINPWILVEGNFVRLTTLDPILAKEYKDIEEKIANGWGIIHKEDEELGI